MSAKGRLVKLVAASLGERREKFLREARVVEAEALGVFRWLRLSTSAPAAEAGTKVQLLLPSVDMRTYSPIACGGGFSLLGFKEAGGPGGGWFSEVRVGSAISFVGPSRSLKLPPGQLLLVGDETSVAVAASFAAARPGEVKAIIHTPHQDDVRRAAVKVGLEEITVIPQGDVEACVAAIERARQAQAGAQVALTGGSAWIVATREALRARKIPIAKNKAYWIPGKRGLD